MGAFHTLARFSSASMALQGPMAMLLAATALTLEPQGNFPKGSAERELPKPAFLPWCGCAAKPVPLLPGAAKRKTVLWFKELHETGPTVGCALVATHAGAALMHHHCQRDNTLLRRVPRGTERRSHHAMAYNRPRRASPHGEAANRVRWGTKQP